MLDKSDGFHTTIHGFLTHNDGSHTKNDAAPDRSVPPLKITLSSMDCQASSPRLLPARLPTTTLLAVSVQSIVSIEIRTFKGPFLDQFLG